MMISLVKINFSYAYNQRNKWAHIFSPSKLNHLMILHIHRDLVTCANSEHRYIFGEFV